jgi:hypothetical protein
MAMSKHSWLGRGLENVPGKPFGWAHNRERQEIEEHLIKRGWSRDDYRFHFRVEAIRHRLHKYKPTFAQRQAAARARGEKWVSPPPGPPPVMFTEDELEHIAQHFERANDPLAIAIWRKAARLDQKEADITASSG